MQGKAQTMLQKSLVYNGKTRTYEVYIPATYSASQPVPLVIGLHGTTSSGALFQQYRGFNNIADTANFIAVYPDGSSILGIRYWNYGIMSTTTADDLGFLETLVDTLRANYSILDNRVYCAGMSNGSFMAYYLACNSLKFAAIAGVTGSMSVNMYNACGNANPIPVLHMHGTDDSTNPYEGTSSMKGIDEVIQFWVQKNQCTTPPTILAIPNSNSTDEATATQFVYENGIHGNSVELFKITGGGHSWPGHPMPASSEVTCMDLDASKEIWRFFSRYERTLQIPEEANSLFRVWPNPTERELFIQSPKLPVIEVEIIDLSGKRVFFQKGNEIERIAVDSIQNGMYILRLRTKKEVAFQKVIIQTK